jgi:hypothetical protein
LEHPPKNTFSVKSHPIHGIKSYSFKTALAIIFTLEANDWQWTKITATYQPKRATFNEIWRQYPQEKIIMSSHQ